MCCWIKSLFCIAGFESEMERERRDPKRRNQWFTLVITTIATITIATITIATNTIVTITFVTITIATI